MSERESHPIRAICPLCGSLPAESCLDADGNVVPAHHARRSEARRVEHLHAEPTADVGRWATFEEQSR